MTAGTSTKDHRTDDEPAAELSWFVRLRERGEVEWSWHDRGAPPLDELAAIRTPRSSASNRHIPVSAYSITNVGVLHLESGLEHDLVRRLDRDPTIRRMVSQPLRLQWTGTEPASHTPDLLALDDDGAVTVWDVRAQEEQDEDFRTKSRITRDACTIAGWHYEVFTGLGATERLNLLWLHGFRRRPPWNEHFESTIRLLASSGQATLGALFSEDDGTAEIKPVIWHLLWTGDLSIDMTSAWNAHTVVTVRGGAS